MSADQKQQNPTTERTDFELALGAAERLADDPEAPCGCLPPCADDWNCACIRRAKLALNVDINVSETWDQLYGS